MCDISTSEDAFPLEIIREHKRKQMRQTIETCLFQIKIHKTDIAEKISTSLRLHLTALTTVIPHLTSQWKKTKHICNC